MFDWTTADRYAQNHVLRRLMIEAQALEEEGSAQAIERAYAYRSAILALSKPNEAAK